MSVEENKMSKHVKSGTKRTNHPNDKRPIDQASPTNIGTYPTSPLKKKKDACG
jgi:hypothetical protein